MASSKRQPKNNLERNGSAPLLKHPLLQRIKLFLSDFFLQQKRIQPSVLVAYSGGLDSTVLLHALHQLNHELPMHLHAMHVHHSLSEHADHWEAMCRNQCAQLGIAFEVRHVTLDLDGGLGVEATARQARYQALASVDVDYICLGQHQHDQAETLLLQLARGAGVKGLSGMAPIDLDRRLLRPLLNVPRNELQDYAQAHQLQWVEDESNADTQFDRNFIRHDIIPAFTKQYPSITQTLARSATHMANASELLDDLAAIDAEVALDHAQPFGALSLDALVQLSPVRQANLVRWWLASNQVAMPSTALLDQILKQLQSTRDDAATKVQVSDRLSVMQYKNQAYLVESAEDLAPINLLWQDEDMLTLPNGAQLRFHKAKGQGLAYQRDGGLHLHIRHRQGGERFLAELGRPRRHLKTMMQSADMPPWQRTQLPLIFAGETLAIIPNIGVDAKLKAGPHEAGLVVTWHPAETSQSI